DEIRRAQEGFPFDPAVESQRKEKADHICQNCCHYRKLNGEPVGTADPWVRKQINIIAESHKVICAKAFEVCKTVYHTADQRYRIKADKQSQDRYGDQHISPLTVICMF